jgi:hypothetical protein
VVVNLLGRHCSFDKPLIDLRMKRQKREDTRSVILYSSSHNLSQYLPVSLWLLGHLADGRVDRLDAACVSAPRSKAYLCDGQPAD